MTEQIENKIGAAIFGLLGAAALVGVLMGATHQLLMVAVCTIMTITLKKEGAKQ